MSLISTTKLYVGNLTQETTEEDLRHTFTEYDVVDVAVVRDQETEESRGFAFLTFGNEDSCFDALEEMDGTPINGSPIQVNEARERRRYHNPRGGGGNGIATGQKDDVIAAISTCINVLQTTLNSMRQNNNKRSSNRNKDRGQRYNSYDE